MSSNEILRTDLTPGVAEKLCEYLSELLGRKFEARFSGTPYYWVACCEWPKDSFQQDFHTPLKVKLGDSNLKNILGQDQGEYRFNPGIYQIQDAIVSGGTTARTESIFLTKPVIDLLYKFSASYNIS